MASKLEEEESVTTWASMKRRKESLSSPPIAGIATVLKILLMASTEYLVQTRLIPETETVLNLTGTGKSRLDLLIRVRKHNFLTQVSIFLIPYPTAKGPWLHSDTSPIFFIKFIGSAKISTFDTDTIILCKLKLLIR